MSDSSARSILVIGAHPDDETLGAGGTIRKHVDRGIPVDVMCLTATETRKIELEAACAILGVRKVYVTLRGDFEIDHNLTDEIMEIILETRPEVIITHSSEDYNENHVMCSAIVTKAVEWASHTTMFGERAHRVKRIYHMEVNSLLSRPNLIVDISKSYDLAVSALTEHKTQTPKVDNYYSKLYNARTRLRGVQAACERGEAFTVHLPEHAGPFYSKNSTDLLV
ncbi:MAG: PIG-L deacetylase family protein [Candidatus Thorarchaeota archaeon]